MMEEKEIEEIKRLRELLSNIRYHLNSIEANSELIGQEMEKIENLAIIKNPPPDE